MSIDIHNEELVLFSEGRKLPTNPSYDSLRRWWMLGKRSKRTGQTVFLEAVQVGSTLYTSQEAFKRFVERLSEDG